MNIKQSFLIFFFGFFSCGCVDSISAENPSVEPTVENNQLTIQKTLDNSILTSEIDLDSLKPLTKAEQADLDQLILVGDWWEGLGFYHHESIDNGPAPFSRPGQRAFFRLYAQKLDPQKAMCLTEFQFDGKSYLLKGPTRDIPKYVFDLGFRSVAGADVRVNRPQIRAAINHTKGVVSLLKQNKRIEINHPEGFDVFPTVTWGEPLTESEINHIKQYFYTVHETSTQFEDSMMGIKKAQLHNKHIPHCGSMHLIAMYFDGKLKGFSFAGDKELLKQDYEYFVIFRSIVEKCREYDKNNNK